MLESIEGGEKKEIMDTLSEIKENMEGLTQEEKAHAVKLYKNLPPNTREILEEAGTPDEINLLDAIKARIEEIKEKFSAYGENTFSCKEQDNSPQEASA
jgi:hypothetical protein